MVVVLNFIRYHNFPSKITVLLFPSYCCVHQYISTHCSFKPCQVLCDTEQMLVSLMNPARLMNECSFCRGRTNSACQQNSPIHLFKSQLVRINVLV